MTQKERLISKYGLSVQRAEIAISISEGLFNREIGELQFIAEKTVRFHTTIIFKAMGVRDRTEVAIAIVEEKYEHEIALLKRQLRGALPVGL